MAREACDGNALPVDFGVGDGEGLVMRKGDDRRMSFDKRIFGRVVAQDVVDSKGEVIVEGRVYV